MLIFAGLGPSSERQSLSLNDALSLSNAIEINVWSLLFE